MWLLLRERTARLLSWIVAAVIFLIGGAVYSAWRFGKVARGEGSGSARDRFFDNVFVAVYWESRVEDFIDLLPVQTFPPTVMGCTTYTPVVRHVSCVMSRSMRA